MTKIFKTTLLCKSLGGVTQRTPHTVPYLLGFTWSIISWQLAWQKVWKVLHKVAVTSRRNGAEPHFQCLVYSGSNY